MIYLERINNNMNKFEQYLEELSDNFDVLLDESLDSIKDEKDGKDWTWEYDGIKYRASVMKIYDIL